MSIGKYNSDGNIYSVAEANAKFSGGGGDISELEEKVNKNTSDISALETKTDGIETNVNKNTSDISALDSKTDGIETNVNKNTSDISALDSKTDGIETNVNTLSEKTDGIETDVSELAADFDTFKTTPATDSEYGLIKLDSNARIYLDGDGHLVIGGRLGQFPDGGVYYPVIIDPTNVGRSSFLISDGAKNLSISGRTFAIMAGSGITCRRASVGATEYRVLNSQANRFALFAVKGGRVALDQTDATENGTALMIDISFANGNPISAYFGPTESDNDIIITVDRTVNPNNTTTKLRVYGTSITNDVINVGQGCGAGGGKVISLGQSCYAGGNQCFAFGNAALSLANNSVALGHTQLVNQQFCFAAGQGHDFTNGSNGTAAVGIASEISIDTAFAVGNGVYNGNGNITRSNALEVTKDGGVVLKSPNGTKYKITVDNDGNITTTRL